MYDNLSGNRIYFSRKEFAPRAFALLLLKGKSFIIKIGSTLQGKNLLREEQILSQELTPILRENYFL